MKILIGPYWATYTGISVIFQQKQRKYHFQSFLLGGVNCSLFNVCEKYFGRGHDTLMSA